MSELEYEDNKSIIIIGATNCVNFIDPVLLRPGRFDRIIEVPLPDYEVRYDILGDTLQKMKCDKSIDIAQLALNTEGYSCAAIVNYCRLAGVDCVKNGGEV